MTQLEDPSICGIVVTHGTDSLEETAYFLDLTINDPRPIRMLTGSQRVLRKMLGRMSILTLETRFM